MNPSQITAFEKLLKTGFCPDPESTLSPFLNGLAHPTLDKTGWVISHRLLKLRHQLSTIQETTAAILATQTQYRNPWLKILAARAKEAGTLSDQGALVQLVTNLGPAASWVEQTLNESCLTPTRFTEQERRLLGVSAEQAQALPMLTRIMAAAAQCISFKNQPLPEIAPIDPAGIRTDINWCPGRLLNLPGKHADTGFILSGSGENQPQSDTMTWVLANPWIFLLAAITYAQDSWKAESRGGLLLELPPGQAAHQPSEIQVLVMGHQGDELQCGTLADLIFRVLDHLNMGIFDLMPSPSELNTCLTPMISSILQNRVWQYREGMSGEQGTYEIHPEFSDECYRIAGARSFNRHGQNIRQAIRFQAEQMRAENRSIK
ncbi:Uncharacterized protein dnl_09210 [Desulfonema limicola]|uniref:Uncharacterized protein n=1 Tax=Desulfonema limicola TaxID=45656 RepID=A0A975B4M1_9BACT|nr:hypothetical protein [Desulfonema limicola]QTA78691.1 Uncharacterized protein dnl_09210 [Desulfonema limicola]